MTISFRSRKALKRPIHFIFYKYCSLYLKLRKEPYKAIFILAHIRSGSTLLQHLLFSNPEIAGFGENHISYNSQEDLNILIQNVYWHLRKIRMKERYVVDKIVHHDPYPIQKDIWLLEDVYTIFLVREPRGSVLSIQQGDKNEEENATDTYVNELARLEEYAKFINRKEQALFLTYGQILNETKMVFCKLQKFLDLQQPLSERYDVLRTTGRGSVGDWSENIKAGRIIREQKDWGIELSQASFERASDAFNHCCNTLSKYCTVIEP